MFLMFSGIRGCCTTETCIWTFLYTNVFCLSLLCILSPFCPLLSTDTDPCGLKQINWLYDWNLCQAASHQCPPTSVASAWWLDLDKVTWPTLGKWLDVDEPTDQLTRSAQRVQTSAERQNPLNPDLDFVLLDPDGDPDRQQNVITWSLGQNPRGHLFCVCWQCGSSSQIRIVIRNGLPDPDSDADHHQNVISWSLGHTRLSIKFHQNPLVTFSTIQWMRISDFGLMDAESDPDRHQNRSHHSLGHALPLQEISSKSVHNFFSYLTDRQTNRLNQKHNLLWRR